MAQKVILSVHGGTTHLVTIDQLNRLQAIITGLGAENYPLFIRMGAVRSVQYQPVTARTLLAEIELFTPILRERSVPGVSFLGEKGELLGGFYSGDEETVIAKSDQQQLSITPRGVRLLLSQFPPPVGFRSHGGLPRGWFDCYFDAMRLLPGEASGVRTAEMGGSGAPVTLSELPPLPPVTDWHFAMVARGVPVSGIEFTQTPAPEAFRDLLHAVNAACTEALRLRQPLQIERE